MPNEKAAIYHRRHWSKGGIFSKMRKMRPSDVSIMRQHRLIIDYLKAGISLSDDRTGLD